MLDELFERLFGTPPYHASAGECRVDDDPFEPRRQLALAAEAVKVACSREHRVLDGVLGNRLVVQQPTRGRQESAAVLACAPFQGVVILESCKHGRVE
jgi:hypothetical protein